MDQGTDCDFDEVVDVLIVGFGGAGACAAIEARRAGAEVLVVDRYYGGGATARSGGIVYLGGGSRQQKAAGYEDDADEMFKYLSLETRGCVSREALRAFCDRSLENLAFLEELDVPFPPSGNAPKTSYPDDDVTLYFSGNELCPPFSEASRTAPRGHRVLGKSLTGGVLYRRLRQGAEACGAEIRYRTRPTRLITAADGSVIGAEIITLEGGDRVAARHARYTKMANLFGVFSAKLHRRILAVLARLEARHGRKTRVRAKGGVILAAGGFIFNAPMVRSLAPNYRRGMPLGTTGDDGSGIELGQSVGGNTDYMHSVGAWRFINPPVPLTEGVMVDSDGQRICNEELYGSAIGAKTADQHGGRAFLILDSGVWTRVFEDVKSKRKLNFQYATALLALFVNRKRAQTMSELEERCLMPHQSLSRTLSEYNARAAAGAPDVEGKSKDHFVPLDRGPYYAVDCSLGNPLFPTPCITLGGLTVNGLTGQVTRKDGRIIDGLYAAGRSAVGICSSSYISGLSLADCVFSGRNTGGHASERARQ